MRSAELTIVLAAGTAAALLATGCETTQQKSARAQVQAERVLATRKPVLVKHANPLVQAERVSVLRSGRRTAVVVLLHNSGAQPVSDLPISLRASGGRYLNRRANLGYFQTHVPAIGAGGRATWVFVTRARVRAREVTALVGPRPVVTRSAERLPTLSATVRGAAATVTNSSSVPQVGLVLYARAQRGGRLVAAGRASVARLAPGQSATVPLSLVGRAAGAPIEVEIPPTIFK